MHHPLTPPRDQRPRVPRPLLRLSVFMGQALVLFCVAPTAAQASDALRVNSCSITAESFARPLQQIREATLHEQCESYRPDLKGMEVGTDPECGDLGVSPGMKVESLSDGLRLSCDVMRFYVPSTLQVNDPLGDLALACTIRYAKRRLQAQLTHNELLESQLKTQNERGRKCAQKIFVRGPEIPLDQVDENALRFYSNYSQDQRIIQESGLTPEQKSEALERLENETLFAEGKKSAVRVQPMVDAFATVIRQEQQHGGLIATAGEPIQWSEEFKSCVGSHFPGVTAASKTLGVLALGIGILASPTGKERGLYDWMLKQPDASIEPIDLFRESYRLNGGDVYLTLLTIENLLSRAWLEPNRDALTQTRKLRPLVRAIGPNADTYGSWYHLFGTMLHGYVRGSARGVTVAQIEALGSFGLNGQLERQETHINRSGALVGGRLGRVIRSGTWRTINPTRAPESLQFDSYIRTNEDLTARIARELKAD